MRRPTVGEDIRVVALQEWFARGVVTSALRSMMRPSGEPARNPSVAVERAYAGEISQRDLPPPRKSISRKARAYLARRGAEPYLSPPPLRAVGWTEVFEVHVHAPVGLQA